MPSLKETNLKRKPPACYYTRIPKPESYGDECHNAAAYIVQPKDPHGILDAYQACRRHLTNAIDSFGGKDVVVVTLHRRLSALRR